MYSSSSPASRNPEKGAAGAIGVWSGSGILHLWLVRPAVLALSLLLLSGCGRDDGIEIRVGPAVAWVEVAATGESRRQGLMGRRALKPDQGLLMAFPRAQRIQLWMLNMEMPLDVGFFDRQGVLLGWRTMEPDGGRQIHTAPAPSLYALEMNKGWFAAHGLVPGARLQLPHPISAE